MKYSIEQLLYLAAKAAKISYPQKDFGGRNWNPIDDDGDAFRLSFVLGLELRPWEFETMAQFRMNIVRRAAYIGEHM